MAVPEKTHFSSGRVFAFSAILALVTMHLISQPVIAHGPQWRTELIPTERLIANLKSKAKANPDDASAQYQLARAYVISAYDRRVFVLYEKDNGQKKAYPTGNYQFDGRWGTWGSWDPVYGTLGVDVFPQTAEQRILWKNTCYIRPCNLSLRYEKEALLTAARMQIENAIVHYERALALKPDALTQLGLAWAHDIAGHKKRAKQLYREIISAAWPQEKGVKWSADGDGVEKNYIEIFTKDESRFDKNMARFITYEAGQYLIALLDRVHDSREISSIRSKLRHLAKNGAANAGITPIIIPLNRTSLLGELVRDGEYVRFNLDGLGARDWQWVTPNAGFLVYVGGKNAPQITSGHQLFGNITFHNFWRDGYEALASLDDNRDGWLRGDELTGLAIWQDADTDGRSRAEELITLETLEISGIAVHAGRADPDSLSNSKGIEYEDGKFGSSYDWISYPRPTNTN